MLTFLTSQNLLSFRNSSLKSPGTYQLLLNIDHIHNSPASQKIYALGGANFVIRQVRITDLKGGEKYEAGKASRAQRPQTNSLLEKERFASSQRGKAAVQVETPSALSLLLEPSNANGNTSGASPTGRSPDKALTNGNANGLQSTRQKHIVAPLTNVTPLVLTEENAENLRHLTPDEIDLCQKIRVHPNAYLMIKEHVFKEALRKNGVLKRKEVKELCKLESQKGSRLYDFFFGAGWLG